MRNMKLIGVGIVIVLALGIISYVALQGRREGVVQGIETVSVEVYREALPGRQIVDVRTQEEYDAGHIPNAENIDFYSPTFSEQFDRFNRDAPLAIYCRSGGRSGQALEVLVDMGFSDVVDLQGGFMAWEKAGERVE